MTGDKRGTCDDGRGSARSGKCRADGRADGTGNARLRQGRRVLTDGGFEAGFFKAVVERVGVGVGVYESNGRFAYVNRAYADLLGMDREDLHGSAVWDVNPEITETGFDDYWSSFVLGETRQHETVHTTTEGTEIPVETHTTAIEVDDTRYHVGTIANISQRIEGLEKLERQDERLEQFASVISHDLRNPLNVAMGRLQLAMEDADTDHLEHVERSLGRIEGLIEDVLTMARDGNRIKEPQPVDIGAIVDRAWRIVESEEATLDVEDDLGTTLSDGTRLREVFENLFDNAVRHGDSSVTVRVGRTDDGLYVADDGSGIPSDNVDDVMEYGYTTQDDGAGFGLAIVEQIVTAHGWSLSLRESTGGGVRVEINGVDFE